MAVLTLCMPSLCVQVRTPTVDCDSFNAPEFLGNVTKFVPYNCVS